MCLCVCVSVCLRAQGQKCYCAGARCIVLTLKCLCTKGSIDGKPESSLLMAPTLFVRFPKIPPREFIILRVISPTERTKDILLFFYFCSALFVPSIHFLPLIPLGVAGGGIFGRRRGGGTPRTSRQFIAGPTYRDKQPSALTLKTTGNLV